MATIIRGDKRGGVKKFQESYNKGFKDIWATEVDTDLDNLYDAWNYGTVSVADGAVTSDKLANGSVTSDKLATNSVTSGHIVDGTVTEADISSDVTNRLVPPYDATQQFKIMTVDTDGNLIWVDAPPAQLVTGQVETQYIANAPNGVTDEKITSVSWSKITGVPAAPTSLPPSGPAGGSLAGTYPNPAIKAGAVGNTELATNAVTNAKVSDVSWAKITGAPTAYPPSGAAGGGLAGSYPSPIVTNASGDFTVAGQEYINGNNLWLGASGMRALLQGLGGTDGRILLSANHAYGPPNPAIGSWMLYMDPNGDYLVGRRMANAAANVTWDLYVRRNDGRTVCNLADALITKNHVAVGNGCRIYSSIATPANWIIPGKDAWYELCAIVQNFSGGLCLISCSPNWSFWTTTTSANGIWTALVIDGATYATTRGTSGASSIVCPYPGLACIYNIPAGQHRVSVYCFCNANSALLTSNTPGQTGNFFVVEYL